MSTTTTISVRNTAQSRLPQYDSKRIVFGANPTDHMFLAGYENGCWQRPRIEPFDNLVLSPLALCFHYGQTVFEGMKAFRQANGGVAIFRTGRHWERLNRSLDRMCMPQIPETLFFDALHSLIRIDQDWVPSEPGTSLYIRPFVIATEARMGVKAADNYLFAVICMPAAAYYEGSIKVKVETEFVRAADGGAGTAKCGGNYGAAFYPTMLANQQGYDQVIWTDAKNNEFMEESGTVNLMFMIDDVLVTPPLSGTILDGVTRHSLLTIARDLGMAVQERKISYHELEAAFKEGKRVEAFGVGTAASLVPIGTIGINGVDYFPDVSARARLYRLKAALLDIQTGKVPDRYGWNDIVVPGIQHN